MSDVSFVSNQCGHDLAVRRVAAAPSVKGTRPVIIVPGYGMNSFIFGFHPAERSLEATLAHHGLVVYAADLRGQGRSRREEGTSDEYGMAELAIDDIGAVIDHVRAREGADKVDLIGVSLGTSLALGHLAHRGSAKVGSFVSLGGLVRWVEIPPVLKVAFAWPALVGMVKMQNTRKFARHALPLVTRTFPRLLSLYVNASSSDLARAAEMVQTVEDPHAGINREIAEWIGRRDLDPARRERVRRDRVDAEPALVRRREGGRDRARGDVARRLRSHRRVGQRAPRDRRRRGAAHRARGFVHFEGRRGARLFADREVSPRSALESFR